MTTSVTERATAIASQLSARAVEHETNRRLSQATVAELKQLDILRAYVPLAYGGPEYDPFQVMQTIETLSHADGATGWCATIASLTSHLSGSITPDVAKAVFGPVDAVVCGAYAPNGSGARNPAGDYTVTGRWAWGSGSSMATWMTGGTLSDDGSARHMLFPIDAINLHDTWDSSGLRGTASHDFSVDRAIVNEAFTVDMRSPTLHSNAPISQMPLFVLFSAGVASVMLGIANRALDELATLADVKKPMGSSKTLNQSVVAQVDRARAEAHVRAARAFLHDSVHQAWSSVQTGTRVDREVRLAARLAASYVGEQAVAAVDLCYRAGGGSAVYATSPLQRCFRDIHTAAAHIMVSPRTYEMVGRHRFGLPIDTSTL